MNQPTNTFDQFQAAMLRKGYDAVVERTWEPNAVFETHSHAFEANALVTQGEMWIEIEGQSEQRYAAGDTFQLAANVLHRERYGVEGATYWVARRNV